MKTQHFLCIAICLSILLALACFSSPVSADDYNTTANFTANDVSTVAPGDSRTLTLIDEFWGLNWDVSGGIGNPVYGDGDTSNDNTGYYAGIETDGRIGVYAEAYYDYGTMDINAPLDINMQTTDSGATTTVNTNYSILSGAGFNTTGADGSVDVGFLADAHFAYTAAASALGVGISIHNSFDPLVDISLFEAAVDAAQEYVREETYGIVDFTADLPDAASTTGSVAAATGLSGSVDASTRTASTSQTNSILTVTGDLGRLYDAITLTPHSISGSLSSDTLGIDIDITATAFDAEIAGDISFNRNFEVTMNPSVHLEFDRPVFVDGISGPVTNVSSLLGSELYIYTQDIVGVTTTYSLDWGIRNRTSVDADASVSLTAGELSASVKLPYIDRFYPGIGPLYEGTYTTPSLGVDIYNERWSVAGQEISGAFFLTNFDSELVTMLDKAIDETTQTFIVAPGSIAARQNLTTIIQNKNTATTPSPDDPKDLFTENSDLFWFMVSNYNQDNNSERVDYLDYSARQSLLDILQSYDPANADYFDFLLDFTDIYNLGVDFQPLFDDDYLVSGLMASFYNLDYLLEGTDGGPTSGGPISSYNPFISLDDVPFLADLGPDSLLGTSFAFFYNDIIDMTDLTVYQSAVDDRASFTYVYSSLEQYIKTPVPEPTTILLFGIGLLGLAGISRKKFS